MADKEKELDPNQKIKSIPFDKIVKIEVSGFFYARLMQALSSHVRDNQFDLLPAIEELKKREPKNQKEYDLITLVSLCTAIEEAAQEQGIIDEHTVEELKKKMDEGSDSGN